MLFNRNRNKMIDVRELQKRGVVRIPRKKVEVPTNNDGFVELGSPSTVNRQPSTETSNQSNADFFGFANTTSQPTTNDQQSTTSFSDSRSGYDKREVDTKITELDNKIYKLEQRLELLEKKLDVNQPNNNVGAMGW